MLRETDAADEPLAEDVTPEGQAEEVAVEEEESVGPLTSSEFSAVLDRAKAASIRPFHEMAATYGRKIIAAVDGFLVGLEEGNRKRRG